MLQADGGTRTAAITGAWVAVHDAVARLLSAGALNASPIRDAVAAVSVGHRLRGQPVLDLDYDEDSGCDTDMNVVMTGAGGFVEIQGTAEGAPFSRGAGGRRCSSWRVMGSLAGGARSRAALGLDDLIPQAWG